MVWSSHHKETLQHVANSESEEVIEYANLYFMLRGKIEKIQHLMPYYILRGATFSRFETKPTKLNPKVFSILKVSVSLKTKNFFMKIDSRTNIRIFSFFFFPLVLQV